MAAFELKWQTGGIAAETWKTENIYYLPFTNPVWSPNALENGFSSRFLNLFLLENYYGPNYSQRPPNSYAEALTPDVMAFGDGALRNIIRFHEVTKVNLMMGLVPL